MRDISLASALLSGLIFLISAGPTLADTIVVSAPLSYNAADFSGGVNLPAFDEKKGMLTSVDVTLSGTFVPGVSIEGKYPAKSQAFYLTPILTVYPDPSPTENPFTLQGQPELFLFTYWEGYDPGNVPSGGTFIGQAQPFEFNYKVNYDEVSNPLKAFVEIDGSETNYFNIEAGSIASPPVPGTADDLTTATGTMTAVYHYRVPEPASFLLLAGGILALGLLRTKNS